MNPTAEAMRENEMRRRLERIKYLATCLNNTLDLSDEPLRPQDKAVVDAVQARLRVRAWEEREFYWENFPEPPLSYLRRALRHWFTNLRGPR